MMHTFYFNQTSDWNHEAASTIKRISSNKTRFITLFVVFLLLAWSAIPVLNSDSQLMQMDSQDTMHACDPASLLTAKSLAALL